MAEQSLNIYMKIVTHDCGMVYMVPTWVPTYMHTCPGCAVQQKKTLSLEKAILENQVRGLKGEITKWQHRIDKKLKG